MNKRGQLAAFIFLGLVIVAIFAFAVYMKSAMTESAARMAEIS